MATVGKNDLNLFNMDDFQSVVQNPPVSLNFDGLAHAWVGDYPLDFSFGIRIKTASGHRSPFNTTRFVYIHPLIATTSTTMATTVMTTLAPTPPPMITTTYAETLTNNLTLKLHLRPPKNFTIVKFATNSFIFDWQRVYIDSEM